MEYPDLGQSERGYSETDFRGLDQWSKVNVDGYAYL